MFKSAFSTLTTSGWSLTCLALSTSKKASTCRRNRSKTHCRTKLISCRVLVACVFRMMHSNPYIFHALWNVGVSICYVWELYMIWLFRQNLGIEKSPAVSRRRYFTTFYMLMTERRFENVFFAKRQDTTVLFYGTEGVRLDIISLHSNRIHHAYYITEMNPWYDKYLPEYRLC